MVTIGDYVSRGNRYLAISTPAETLTKKGGAKITVNVMREGVRGMLVAYPCFEAVIEGTVPNAMSFQASREGNILWVGGEDGRLFEFPTVQEDADEEIVKPYIHSRIFSEIRVSKVVHVTGDPASGLLLIVGDALKSKSSKIAVYSQGFKEGSSTGSGVLSAEILSPPNALILDACFTDGGSIAALYQSGGIVTYDMKGQALSKIELNPGHYFREGAIEFEVERAYLITVGREDSGWGATLEGSDALMHEHHIGKRPDKPRQLLVQNVHSASKKIPKTCSEDRDYIRTKSSLTVPSELVQNTEGRGSVHLWPYTM